MRLIGLVGKKQSGKDTLFNELFNQVWFFGRVKYSDQCPERFAFADQLKSQLADALGITLEYLNEHKEFFRAALQEFGHQRRVENPTHWIEELVFTERWQHSRGWKFVTDVRYQNEADFIKSQGGLMVRIVRPQKSDAPEDLHCSETEQDRIPCDYTVQNTGTLGDYRIAISHLIPILCDAAQKTT